VIAPVKVRDLELNQPASPTRRAEAEVLGSCLIQADDLLPTARAQLKPADFHERDLQAIYQTALDMADRGAPIDMVLVQHEMARLGRASLVPSWADVIFDMDLGTTRHFPHWLAVAKENANRRRLATVGAQLVDLSSSSATPGATALRARESLAEVSDATASGPERLGPITVRVIAEVEEAGKSPNGMTGIPSGLATLDHLLCGFQPSDLIVLAARPSVGKSAAALTWAHHAATLGYPTLFITLEMSPGQLAKRILGKEANINANLMRFGRIDNEGWASLAKASNRLAQLPIWIDAPKSGTLSAVIASISAAVRRDQVSFVVIDYLGLITPDTPHENRAREVAMLTRALKHLAQELNIPIILLSQLNRALVSRANKRPELTDLRESGAVEQDADVVLFIHREILHDRDANPEAAEIIIAKQRNGPIGVCECRYIADRTTFVEQINNPFRPK